MFRTPTAHVVKMKNTHSPVIASKDVVKMRKHARMNFITNAVLVEMDLKGSMEIVYWQRNVHVHQMNLYQIRMTALKHVEQTIWIVLYYQLFEDAHAIGDTKGSMEFVWNELRAAVPALQTKFMV